jgi:urease accessory protein
MSARRKKILKRLAAVCVVFAWTPGAEAHLVTTGLGPVYDGMGHFLLSPGDWLPVIALALLAGLRGAEAGRRTLFGLPVAWLSGGLAAMAAPGLSAWPEQWIAAISFLVLGILVASDLALPAKMVLALAVGLGLVHGFGNGAAMSEAGAAAGALELIGVAVALFVLVALAAAFVAALRPPWTRVAVRVGGSWIAAMGLLLLGWCLRKNGA